MKVAGLLLAALVACASAAVPAPIEAKNEALADDSGNTRLVAGIITNAIDSFIDSMVEAGMDPFVIEQYNIGYALPVPILFSGAASITNLRVTGISNIVINNINFALLTQRLTMDISLPAIEINLDDAWFDVTILGHNFAGRTTSRIAVINPGVSGEVRMNVGIISGISVRSVDLEFDHHRMEYNGFVNLLGMDLTPTVSRIIHHDLPASIRELNNEINELIAIIVTQVIEDMLP